MATSETKMTPMPYSMRLTILAVIVSEHTLLFMIPTFVAYMMDGFLNKEYSGAELDSQISYHSGRMEGINGMASFVGCLLWGVVSDKIGRKYGMIIVLSGMIVASLGFGLAPSFEVAVFWRCIAGLMAGVVPISKALVQDVSDSTNVAILYSYLGAGYGVGSILGPIIGGTLAHPEKYSDSLTGTFLEKYPYFLPQFVHSCIALTAMIMIIINVPYKKPTPPKKSANIFDLRHNHNYLISLVVFILIVVVQFGYRISMALWVKVDFAHEGPGWTTEDKAGYMNSASGVLVTAYHLGLVPIFAKKFGIIKSCILFIIQLLPVVILISYTYILDTISMWTLLIIFNALSIVGSTAFISFISMAVANSVDPAIVGAVMGVTQSVIAFIRGVTIGSFGALFGWSQTWNMFFPFDVHFSFLMVAVVLLLNWLVIKLWLDPSVEKRFVQKPEEIPMLEKKQDE